MGRLSWMRVFVPFVVSFAACSQPSSGGDGTDGDADTDSDVDTDADTDTDADCPASCNGCCIGQECLPGNTDGNCGADGDSCVECDAAEACQDSACVDVACSETCGGCCSADTCLDGNANGACGSSGSACTECEDYEACSVGSCEIDDTSKWIMTIIDATIVDADWDWDGNTPDAYVVLTADGTPLSSDYDPDTSFPVWNFAICWTAGGYLGGPLDLDIYDCDGDCTDLGDGDDLIGTCDYSVTESDMRDGSFLADCGNAHDVSFAIAPDTFESCP